MKKIDKSHHVYWAQDTSKDGKGNIKNFGDGQNFVPMIWGKGNLEWPKTVAKSPVLLTFDNPGQQNLSPAAVAKLWPKVVKIAKDAGAVTLVGPSVNWANGAFGKPHVWYKEFFKQCKGCRIDAIAMTVWTCSVGQMKSRLDVMRKFKK